MTKALRIVYVDENNTLQRLDLEPEVSMAQAANTAGEIQSNGCKVQRIEVYNVNDKD
jgi:hypothetical protein